VSWAWARGKFGSPWWVDLSYEVGSWTDARGIEPPPELAWTAPADASNRSFPSQFVAAVLALGTNVAHPYDALMSAGTFADECRISWSTRAARNLSDAHLLSSCVLFDSWRSSKEEAEADSAQSVSELVRSLNYEDYCRDLLDIDAFHTFKEAVYMATLVQALPAMGSCAGGCPLSRPLCNGTLGCVRPTCADVKPLCNDNTDAGALARLACGVTCGCGNLASDLLWIGPNSGCLPKCRADATAMADTASCSDAQPGSAELAALVRLFEPHYADLGCFASNFEFDRQFFCDQEFSNTYGHKSLVPFCPVSCGCIDDTSKPGCPRACSAPEPPTFRDLSDAQLAVANAAMTTWNKKQEEAGRSSLYPPSCSGLNATVCDALLTAWHRHPCPLACGIDPTAPSTSSTTSS
jgi:hypothetical protein